MSLPYNDQSHLLNKKNPNCTLDVHQCHNQQNKDHNFPLDKLSYLPVTICLIFFPSYYNLGMLQT